VDSAQSELFTIYDTTRLRPLKSLGVIAFGVIVPVLLNQPILV
jgi:hypothetical protein